jgi:FkbM family methyltransferase
MNIKLKSNQILNIMNVKLAYHFLKFHFEKLYFFYFFPQVVVLNKHNSHNSQFGQDYYLNNFIISEFKSTITGTVVEIGSNHPLINNNSFFLYNKFETISIDPIDYSEIYSKLRPNTKFINIAISNFTGSKEFYKVNVKTWWEDQMSSFDKPNKKKFNYNKVYIPVDTLNNVLSNNLINKVSFLFIDVEGHEKEVLEKFNFSKYSPDLIIIENKFNNNSIRSLLFENGYIFKYRIWTSDDIYFRNI